MKSADICEMCGHHVAIRRKAHIVAENVRKGNNILIVCPTCHIMFDTHVKPKVFMALLDAGSRTFPNHGRSRFLNKQQRLRQSLWEEWWCPKKTVHRTIWMGNTLGLRKWLSLK
jgi:ribosome-binding protein aMBF1 (putative translation factor)